MSDWQSVWSVFYPMAILWKHCSKSKLNNFPVPLHMIWSKGYLFKEYQVESYTTLPEKNYFIVPVYVILLSLVNFTLCISENEDKTDVKCFFLIFLHSYFHWSFDTLRMKTLLIIFQVQFLVHGHNNWLFLPFFIKDSPDFYE